MKTDVSKSAHISLLPYWMLLVLFGVILAFLPLWGLILLAILVFLAFLSMAFGVHLNQVDIFSPYVIFPVLWIACVAVGSRIISIEQVPWNDTVWMCSIGAVIFYFLGLVGAEWYLAAFRRPDLQRRQTVVGKWNGQKLFLIMLAWQLAAFGCMMYEFKHYVGGIPLFSRSWEFTRLYNPQGYLSRLVHLLGYSFMLQAIVLQVYLYSQKKLFSLGLLPFWLMLGFALCCAGLWGSRHTLFIPLAAGVVAFHYLHKRLKPTHLIFLGIAASLFIGAVGFVRKMTYFEERDVEYKEVLQHIGYSARFPVLDQVHNTVAMNFETFRKLTETFPTFQPYRLGRQTFFAVYSLLPGKQETLGEIQNRIWNTGFYGNLTATYMGVPYVDFGVPGVILYTLILAIFIRLLYFRIQNFPTIFNIMLYSFFCYHLILMPYDNTITKLNFIFDLLILWGIDLLVKEIGRKRIKEA